MLKLTKRLYLTCFLLIFLACSRNQTSSSSVIAQSYRSESNQNNLPQDPAINRFIVPPEMAVMSVKIRSRASSFLRVTELLEASSAKLLKSISKIEGCSAKVVEYHHPSLIDSSKRILSYPQNYSNAMELEIQISFAEMKDINERITQINNCLQAISQLKIEQPQEDKDASIYLSLSRVMPTINDVGKYRKKLLQGKFTGLKEVANYSEPATQFRASDTRCTSQGTVEVINRSLSGIELDIDFDCHYHAENQGIAGEK